MVNYSNDALFTGCLFFAFFAVFFAIGTVYYAIEDEYGWAQGFYNAVNLGFVVGWTYYEPQTEYSQLFSVFYMLIGMFMFVAFVLFIYYEVAELSKDKWFVSYIYRSISSRKSNERKDALKYWEFELYTDYELNVDLINLFMLVIILFIGGTAFICVELNKDIIYGLYFTMNTATSTGLVQLPVDSSGSTYVFWAVFAIFVITVYSTVALFIAETLLLPDFDQLIAHAFEQDVKPEELSHIRELLNGNKPVHTKYLEINEFTVLMIARLKIIDFQIMAKLYEKFDALDVTKARKLDIEVINQTIWHDTKPYD